jgi:SLOG in TRPM, prokaryote
MMGDNVRHGHGPRHATVEDRDEVPAALRSLGLRCGRPVLVSVGGAGGLTPEHLDAMASLMRERVVPALDRWGAAVVDGGTDSGVMRVMGEARDAAKASFPLVGVAARGTVTVPGENGSGTDTVDLEPHHTQVLLVPGHTWGDESPWLSHVATVIAAGHPSATLVVNGGEITYDDIAHAVAAGRPVIVVAGTGRTADAIAAAAGQTTGDPVNERAARLAASPLLRVVRLNDPDGLTSTLEAVLAPQPQNVIFGR